MFVNQEQLRHLLTPDQYSSARQHELEVERLLRPGWHFVATTGDLPRHGDFLTLDLLGQPLQLRNFDGEVHAYRNVCAHRHSLLTSQARGFDPRFRCQYHGWEYNKEGRTGHIPDARCFRPFDRENARLHKFRTARCGELIFVSLADDGPSLEDQLGTFYSLGVESFGPPFRQVWKWQADYATNWKVPIENSLESYHIPCLHARTFGTFPPEEQVEHGLTEGYTTYATDHMDSGMRKGMERTAKRLGLPFTGLYTHWHIHPNLIFVTMDLFRMAQLIVPTSPTTSRTMVWLFAARGSRRGPLVWLAARATAWLATLISRRVLLEDAPIFAEVQRGLESSRHPGVIGTREERVYVFQDYVARRCSDPQPSED